MAGTIAYMSPECLKGELQSFSADVWSLGILIFEMYHGTEPFVGDTVESRLQSLYTTAPVFDVS